MRLRARGRGTSVGGDTMELPSFRILSFCLCLLHATGDCGPVEVVANTPTQMTAVLPATHRPAAVRADDPTSALLLQQQVEQIAAELAALSAVVGPAGPAAPPRPGVYVVTAYGADPTGLRDSTKAIQAACTAAARGMGRGEKTGEVWQPEVRFPSGHYTVSDTINISGVPANTTHGGCSNRAGDTTWCMLAALQIVGEGTASIEQRNRNKDIIAGATTVRIGVHFINFVGGRNQLNIGNNNTDQGFIKIADCSFANSNSAAIRIVGPSCPDASCPAESHPLVGSFSSQVIVRDCEFHKCIQALVVWSDWASFSDSWISANENMTDMAVIENHDKIMVSNILGVPQNRKKTNATRQRWIDNYSHRVDGGTVHVRDVRFGGESGGITALVNWAPFFCQEITSKLETEMCGRVNRSGPIPRSGLRGAGGSSVIIEGSLIAGSSIGKLFSTDVVLEEVPAQLVLRDNWVQAAADDPPIGGEKEYRLVRVVDEIDLDGPYLSIASRKGTRARPTFEIAGTNWNTPVEATGDYEQGTSAVFDLPQQLQPFQSGRVDGVAAPTVGTWRAGSVVYNRRAWSGIGTEEPAAWVCVLPGTPGTWHNVSY